MSDAARHAEAVRDGIAGVTPSDGQVAQILARTAEAPLLPLGDQLFQRLLQHRIVFLGQQVDDDIANRICAGIWSFNPPMVGLPVWLMRSLRLVATPLASSSSYTLRIGN